MSSPKGDKNVVRCHRVGNCADGVRQGNPETPYAELRRLLDHPWAPRRRRCFQDGGLRRGVPSGGPPPDERRGSRRQSVGSSPAAIVLILSIMASIFSCVRLGFRRVNLSITLPSLTVWPMTVPSARRRPRIPWSVSEGTRHGHWPWNATTGAWAGRGSRT